MGEGRRESCLSTLKVTNYIHSFTYFQVVYSIQHFFSIEFAEEGPREMTQD